MIPENSYLLDFVCISRVLSVPIEGKSSVFSKYELRAGVLWRRRRRRRQKKIAMAIAQRTASPPIAIPAIAPVGGFGGEVVAISIGASSAVEVERAVDSVGELVICILLPADVCVGVDVDVDVVVAIPDPADPVEVTPPVVGENPFE